MRSTIAVTADMLASLRARAPECGFEVLAKIGYDRKLDMYLVEIEGPYVPNAKQVVVTFYDHQQDGRKWLTAEFDALPDDHLEFTP